MCYTTRINQRDYNYSIAQDMRLYGELTGGPTVLRHDVIKY